MKRQFLSRGVKIVGSVAAVVTSLLLTEYQVNAAPNYGWDLVAGKSYWYENGVKQGLEGRGKEIYDPGSDNWYWLDSIQGGAKAVSKDVYQESNAGQWADRPDGTGKWVRYNEQGHMVKGWDTTADGRVYYFDPVYGTMAKGDATIDGVKYHFDQATGVRDNCGISTDNHWEVIGGNEYWYENGIRQGYDAAHAGYRGKEIYDPGSNAWYWLDNVDQGKKAVSKDVYQESVADDAGNIGKWVRYDAQGHMIKGWNTNANGTYYFDLVYGSMYKGAHVIDGKAYVFDNNTGVMISTKTPAEKPSTLKVMVDGTVCTMSQGASAFRKQLQEALDVNIQWIQPDHSGYYDAVATAFNYDFSMPDIVILSSDYYSLFAANGLLWDMTDAWNTSDTKFSGRLISTADNVVNANIVPGPDGNNRLYGMSVYRGNGCATYMKGSWLREAGIDVGYVRDNVMTFGEYYSCLKQMKQYHNYVISSPGFVSAEAPYTNYLPEFYQNAQFTFYKNSEGRYVDGFSEQAMQDALQRIQTAVSEGIIDRESINNSTANSRDKFAYDKEGAGVFTYWSGTWCNTLVNNLQKRGMDSELIQIKPIAELGAYVERLAPVWCITSACKNPEGAYQYFIDKMLDGDTVQMLWTYGAKGTHWDTKEEAVVLQGKEDKPIYYYEGQFHMLPNPEKPTAFYSKNHIDPIISLASFKDGSVGSQAVTSIPELAIYSRDRFANESKPAEALPMTEAMGEKIGDINTVRKQVVGKVALGDWTVEYGMSEYLRRCGSDVQKVLDSLNK